MKKIETTDKTVKILVRVFNLTVWGVLIFMTIWTVWLNNNLRKENRVLKDELTIKFQIMDSIIVNQNPLLKAGSGIYIKHK
jgi:hypothetical protein